jgi:SAM-dependent methyltransferase
MPRMYEELAEWYPLITAPHEYEGEARWYTRTLREQAQRDVRRVLELGSGAGANASYMKRDFELVLVDRSKKMLDMSRKLNPELDHRIGDMRTFRLGEKFDAVFIHDAASYLVSADDIRQTAQTALHHLNPGGVVMFCPDDLAENFKSGLESGGHDGDDGRALRYLAWSSPNEDPDRIITDYAFILRYPDGRATTEHDRHITGRLSRETWLTVLGDVGFSSQTLPFDLPDEAEGKYEVVVGLLK